MRRASCGAAPVCTTAGPTTAIVSRPSSFTCRRMLATSCTICALGFSLLTLEAMNSNGWLSRGRSSGSTRMPRWPVTKRSPAPTSLIDTVSAVPSSRSTRMPQSISGCSTRTQSPCDADERDQVGGRVEALGEDAVHVARLEHDVLRLHGDHAVVGDGREDLVEVRGVAAEDAHHRVGRVVLHAPDLEREHLELAVEVHHAVHDLRHHERVDEVALDLDVLVWLVGHGDLP